MNMKAMCLGLALLTALNARAEHPSSGEPRRVSVSVCVGGSAAADYADPAAAIEALRAREPGVAIELRLEAGAYRVVGLALEGRVSIVGPGAGRCVLEAAEAPGIAEDRVLAVREGAVVRLEGLTVRHGRIDAHPRYGAGILNEGELELISCVVRDNQATWGVGILNEGRLLATDSRIEGNLSVPRPAIEESRAIGCGGSGSGLRVMEGSFARLERCQVSGNRAVRSGGAVHVSCEGRLELVDCVIRGNEAGTYGGGLSVRGEASLEGTVVEGNRARMGGAGLFNQGRVALARSRLSGNLGADYKEGGGGLGVFGSGAVTLLESTEIGTGGSPTVLRE